MEPLGRIELPTFPLPMGCYTPKPQWQCPGHQWARFNHCGLTCVSATDSRVWHRSPGRLPRSHSLVLRKTGNLVGFSLGSSNLPLGATLSLSVLRRTVAARPLCGALIRR